MTRSYDPDDAEQVEARAKSADLRKQQLEADWRWLLAAPQGRRILGDILNSTGLWRGSYMPGDALGTAYAEGRRSVGLDVYAVVTAQAQGTQIVSDLMTEALIPHGNRARNTAR